MLLYEDIYRKPQCWYRLGGIAAFDYDNDRRTGALAFLRLLYCVEVPLFHFESSQG